MISARSHLPLLSGSKILLLCFLVFSFGCKTTKRSSTSSSTRSSKTTKKNSTTKKTNPHVEEIQWTIIDPEEKPPIGAPTIIKTKKQGAYSVSMLIPFDGEKAGSAELTSKSSPAYKFLCYYAGAKMASEDRPTASSVDVNVFDSKSMSLSSILNDGRLQASDVIIGPYDTEELKQVAEFAKENAITHISPWKSSKSIAASNPYHVQTRPSLLQHYEKMVESAVKSFPGSKLFVVGKSSSSDKKRMDYIGRLASAMGRDDITKYTVNEDSLRIGETAFDSIFVQGKTNVFMVPNWSSNDEGFIYGCVRRLRVEKGDAKVVVFGMPKMMDTEKITYDFYNNLNIHIVRSEFMDKASQKAKNMRSRFFNEFNAFPTEDLYEGYDLMTFVLNNLDDYGQNFHTKVGADRNAYIQTSYDLVGVPKSPGEPSNKPDMIKYYENRSLSVIEFRNGRFQKK